MLEISSRFQKGLEAPAAIQSDQIIATTDMGVADINLRHGAPPSFFHHFRTARGFFIDVNFFDFRHAFFCQ